jgi:hypothetical protein
MPASILEEGELILSQKDAKNWDFGIQFDKVNSNLTSHH